MTKKHYIKPESVILEVKFGAIMAGISGGKTDPDDGGDDNLAKPGVWEDFELEDNRSSKEL